MFRTIRDPEKPNNLEVKQVFYFFSIEEFSCFVPIKTHPNRCDYNMPGARVPLLLLLIVGAGSSRGKPGTRVPVRLLGRQVHRKHSGISFLNKKVRVKNWFDWNFFYAFGPLKACPIFLITIFVF